MKFVLKVWLAILVVVMLPLILLGGAAALAWMESHAFASMALIAGAWIVWKGVRS
jgi:hypothetical protein